MNATDLLHPAALRRTRETASAAISIVDVRTPAEFETEHIPGSCNVPLDQLAARAAEFSSTDTPVVLVCRSGRRAERARTMLQRAGVRQLRVLDGGLHAWLAAGHDVTRGRARMSLERQVRITAGAVSAVGALLALLVSPLFAVVPALVGGGLVFAGVTDTCAMASLLSRLPYNQRAGDAGTAGRAARDVADLGSRPSCSKSS